MRPDSTLFARPRVPPLKAQAHRRSALSTSVLALGGFACHDQRHAARTACRSRPTASSRSAGSRRWRRRPRCRRCTTRPTARIDRVAERRRRQHRAGRAAVDPPASRPSCGRISVEATPPRSRTPYRRALGIRSIVSITSTAGRAMAAVAGARVVITGSTEAGFTSRCGRFSSRRLRPATTASPSCRSSTAPR